MALAGGRGLTRAEQTAPTRFWAEPFPVFSAVRAKRLLSSCGPARACSFGSTGGGPSVDPWVLMDVSGAQWGARVSLQVGSWVGVRTLGTVVTLEHQPLEEPNVPGENFQFADGDVSCRDRGRGRLCPAARGARGDLSPGDAREPRLSL